jgi:hypothetical protein
VKTNDLPHGHTTGTFPVGVNDPAVAYDRNPNHIAAQSITWSLPAGPTAAGAPSCTPGGPIGVLTDGVVLFNALDGEGRDAAAREVLDSCGGHPDLSSTYHHHESRPASSTRRPGGQPWSGTPRTATASTPSATRTGTSLTNASLDACHGRTSTVTWNAKKQKLYHYDATLEYPYTLGCFHGTPINTA